MNETIVGGQALIEGVMMKNGNKVCAAIRRKNGKIELKIVPFSSKIGQNKFFSFVIVRGVVSLFEMIGLGYSTLKFSAKRAMLDQQNSGSKKDSPVKEKIESSLYFILSILLAFLFFIFIPYRLSEMVTLSIGEFSFNIIAGFLRVIFFISYVYIISKFQDIKRVFQFHGAEHIVVNAFEKKMELEPKRLVGNSTLNPRCGTSFVFLLLLISIIFFSIFDSFVSLQFGKPSLFMRIVYHLVLMPLIIGISFEFLRFSSKISNNPFIKFLISPGLALQKITTKNPSISQIEVAVVALKSCLTEDISFYKNLEII